MRLYIFVDSGGKLKIMLNLTLVILNGCYYEVAQLMANDAYFLNFNKEAFIKKKCNIFCIGGGQDFSKTSLKCVSSHSEFFMSLEL